MTTQATPATAPKLGFPFTSTQARFLREWFSTRDPARWPAPPEGDGRPAMLIPGFLAGDASLTRMALWLRRGGYSLARSGIAWNTGCMEATVETLVVRLERAVEEAGKPALLVGQSRGGSIGRALTVLRPDLVQKLVTLGSPMLDQLAVARRVWPSIGVVGLLGTLGVPGMFSLSCARGACCARTRAAVVGPFPDEVEFVSFYSRTDEVVRWEACLDPFAASLEVQTSHVGMAMSREVWAEIAAVLSA
jgi:triacylglycerol lipase